MNKKIIIAGGGISGIYCSILLKKQLNDVEVIVLESNPSPLKKLLSTGNGRCNLSNEEMDVSFYHSDDLPMVDKMIHQFSIDELDAIGLMPVHLNHLIYPKSEQALSVKRVLLNTADTLGVKIITNQHVTNIDYVNHMYCVTTQEKQYHGDYCILAMGSNASKLSGSDDDRYQILRRLNLKVTDLEPSLCALNTKKVYPFKGVRVKGKCSLFKENQLIHSETGELLFTDYGISGICVMQLSHYMTGDPKKYRIELDLFNDLTQEELNKMIEDRKQQGPHYLDGLLNTKLAEYFESKGNPLEIGFTLKHLTFDILSKRDKEYAQVISGGLSLKEVNESLEVMQYPKLYVIGELLNVNGLCGGYNIHFALSSAKQVALSIVKELC